MTNEPISLLGDFEDHFHQFDPVDRATWQQAAVDSLKGGAFDQLVTTLPGDINLQPLYAAEDTSDHGWLSTLPGSQPFVRGRTVEGALVHPWLVAQAVAGETAEIANTTLQTDLAAGLTAIILNLTRPTSNGSGVHPVTIAADVAILFRDIDLAATLLVVDAGVAALPGLALLVAAARQNGIEDSALSGWLRFDPLAALATEGTLPTPLDLIYDEMAALARWTANNAPKISVAGILTEPYHEAGANPVQELAFSMATAVETLRYLTARGLALDEAARQCQFGFAAGTQFFPEIAKLRAARILWSRIVVASGGDEQSQQMRLHVRTAQRHMSLIDPQANMLRATTAALASAVAGADSIEVSPFDSVLGTADDFSRRIARNVQIILQEEVNLTRLIDPAGGAAVVEWLTDQLARQAWALFQEIEAGGGMMAALSKGTIQEMISVEAAAAADRLARREDIMVGVNAFAGSYVEPVLIAGHQNDSGDAPETPNAAGKAWGQLAAGQADDWVERAIVAAEAGATIDDLTRTLQGAESDDLNVRPLMIQRIAEPYERQRAAAGAIRRQTDSDPAVAILTLGKARDYKTRTAFTLDFLRAGGFTVKIIAAQPSPEATLKAVAAAEVGAVVLVGPDVLYASEGAALLDALAQMVPELPILVAGQPDSLDADHHDKVAAFIYQGADCIATSYWLLHEMLSREKTAHAPA